MQKVNSIITKIPFIIILIIFVAAMIIMINAENEYLLLSSKIIATLLCAYCSVKSIYLSIKNKSKVKLGISIVCAVFSIVFCVCHLFFLDFVESHSRLFFVMHFAVYPIMNLSGNPDDELRVEENK